MAQQVFGGVSRDLAAETAAALRPALLRDAAAIGAMPGGKPFLVLLAGLPGTGKSQFVRGLLQRAPMAALESDRLRKMLVDRPTYTPEESGRLFAACHLLIEEFLTEGRRVIFDATNLTEAFRRPVYEIAERAGSPLLVMRFTAPPPLVRKRLADRLAGANPLDNSDAGWTIYSKMRPHEEPIPRAHVTVDSSADTAWALELAARQIGRLAPAANL